MKKSEKKIAERAYQKYIERGSAHGNDMTDWLDAEKELKVTKKPAAKVQKKSSPPAKKSQLPSTK
jgi:hypothetical protein